MPSYTRTTSSGAPLLPTELSRCSATELVEVIGQIDGELFRLHQEPDGELRSLDATEQQMFDDLILTRRAAEDHLKIRRAYDRGGTRSRNMERAYQGLDRGTTRRDYGSGIDDPHEVLTMGDKEARDRALGVLEARGYDLPSDSLDYADQLLRSTIGEENPYMDGSDLGRRLLITESDAYRSAFTEMLTSSTPMLSAQEVDAVRAFRKLESRGMNEGTGSAGLFGLPVLIDPSIMLSSGAGAAPIMNISRVVPTNTNVWKGVSSAPPVFSWDAEGSVVSDDSPTLAQPTITVYTTRGFIPYTIEVGQDYPSFAEEMAQLLAQGYLDIVASTTATGTGSSQPFGVFTKLDATAGSEVLATTAGAIGAVDVFNAWNAVPERFRSRANWLMSVSVESQIRSFSSANQSSAYFTVDLGADGVSRLNGRPVTVTDYAPAFTTATSHQNRLIVGDFYNYIIARRVGLNIEGVQHLFDTTTGRPIGQRGFFAYARLGADVGVTNALRLLNQT